MSEEIYGLSEAEVSDRIKEGRVNKTKNNHQKTTGQIIRSHTLTYFNILNFALAAVVLWTGQWKHVLFIGVVFANAIVGIFQELRVKKLIDQLSVITAARAKVRRNGLTQEIDIEDIVENDMVLMAPGDQITTDGSVVRSDGLEVNESMLTGESRPIAKAPGDPILSGSFVVAGTGVYETEKVGNATYAATLVEKAQTKKRASSEMQRTIGTIIKVVSVLIIPLGFLLFKSQMAAAETVGDAIVRTVSGIIGMIPEGLVLLTSINFILGVGRLAQKNALVQEMEAIEALARVNILCTDKTGTITTGDLSVTDVVSLANLPVERIADIMKEIGGAFADKNETQKALDAYFGTANGWKVREKIPFSSERKYRAVGFESRGDYVLGAPEFLVPDNENFLGILANYTKEGYRVLLLGKTEAVHNGTIGRVIPVAIIVLSDVIKTDAAEVFSYFADHGVQVKVISGDHPETVSTVAKKAGVRGYEHYIDASTLPEEPEAFAKAIEGYNIFGRVRPEQKQKFVKAWQAGGSTVGMVGDGVNDVLAIKDSDCGIAMAAGSEAAKHSAHIVLLDSDFTSMKDIVKEGREIISNIERVSSLYLTKTIYSMILVLIYILIRRNYPFTTLQMGLINGACIGIPSFMLTLEQQEKVSVGGFLRQVLKVAAPGAFTMVTTMLLIQLMNEMFGWTEEIYSTFVLVLGSYVGLLIVAQVCSPLNTFHRMIVYICIGLVVLAIVFLPGFYDIHGLWMWWSLLLIPMGLLVAMLIYWYSRLTNRFVEWWYRER